MEARQWCGHDAGRGRTCPPRRQTCDALFAFLDCHHIERKKVHETITRTSIMALRHFMERTPDADSADAFISQNPLMLDSKIMLTHYSAELLFPDEASAQFREPDRDPIPGYGS